MRSPRQGIAAVSAVLVFAACNASDPVPVIEREIAPPPRRVERLEREHYLGMAVPEHEPVPVPNIRGECEPGETLVDVYLAPLP